MTTRSSSTATTSETSANRPVRQRKTVVHYSDDNPNTFTVKRRKGDPPLEPDDDGHDARSDARRREAGPPHPSSSSAVAPAGPGRTRRGRPPAAVPARDRPATTASRGSRGALSSGGSASASTKARGAKPPPSKSSSSSLSSPAAASSSFSSSSRKRKFRVVVEASGPLAGDDAIGSSSAAAGTVVNHSVWYQPILPPDWMRTTAAPAASTAKNAASGVGSTAAAAPSGGRRRNAAPQAGPADAVGGDGWRRAPLPASVAALGASIPVPLPVSTRLDNHSHLHKDPPLTCWSTRQTSSPSNSSPSSNPDSSWAVCGDAAGRVHLVALHPRASLWKSWDTDASLRERDRTFKRPAATIAYPNAVLAVAWWSGASGAHQLAALTARELICWDGASASAASIEMEGSTGSTATLEGSSSFRSVRTGSWGPSPISVPVDDAAGSTSATLSSSFASTAAHANQRIQLEFHPRKGHKLLWVPAAGPRPRSTTTSSSSSARNSLYLLEQGRRSCRPASLHCLSAAWDAAPPSELAAHRWSDDCVLAVIRQEEDALALVRYDLSANRIWTHVTLGAVLPPAVRTAHVQVHRGASRTVVTLCTSRGIYVHDPHSLECLAVVGETVALHGRHIAWDSCAVLPEPHVDDSAPSAFAVPSLVPSASAGGGGGSGGSGGKGGAAGTKQQRAWMQLDLASAPPPGSESEDPDEDLDEAPPPCPLQRPSAAAPHLRLVALPQPFKQPIEMQSTLHVWKLEDPASHPLSLSLPPGGVAGWTVALDAQGGWKIAGLCAEFGTAWEWKAALHSDFAGREYPVGYRLLQDNVEYIEDEDELDQVVVYEDELSVTPHSPVGGLINSPARSTASSREELEQALRRSAEDAPVHVLPEESLDLVELAAASCPPRGSTATGLAAPSEEATQEESSPAGPPPPEAEHPLPPPLLACLPQYKHAVEEAKGVDASSAEQPVTCPPAPPSAITVAAVASAPTSSTAATAAAAAAIAKRGKRTRTANVEAVLQASVVPELRRRMAAGMKQWGDGRGSSCPETTGIGEPPSGSPAKAPSPSRSHARNFQPPSDCGGEDSTSQPERDAETMSEASEGVARPQSSNGGSVVESLHQSEVTEAPSSVELQPRYAATERANDVRSQLPNSALAPASAEATGMAEADPSASHAMGAKHESAFSGFSSNGTAVDKERLALQLQLNARERDRLSPSISSKVSAEEKELALELLMLSPGPLKASPTTAPAYDTKPKENGEKGSLPIRRSFFSDSKPANPDGDAVVTPSEQSPNLLLGAVTGPAGAASSANDSSSADPVVEAVAKEIPTSGADPMTHPSVDKQDPTTSVVPLSMNTPSFCTACYGRFVIHRCGKRDKPIDYDAIERAEKEQKEREEAEKLQRRIEKRRAAEARRREARRKKKEEEERMRVEEEEKLRQLESDRFPSSHIHERSDETATDVRSETVSNAGFGWNQESIHPSFSPLKSHSNGASAPIRTTASHAFRLSDSAERNEDPYYQRPTPQSYHGSTQPWNSSTPTECHVDAPLKENQLRGEVPVHAGYINDNAQAQTTYDHDRTRPPSEYYAQRIEVGTTRHEEGMNPTDQNPSLEGSAQVDQPESGIAEGVAVNHSSLQYDVHSDGQDHRTSTNDAFRPGYYSGTFAYAQTASSSVRPHLTDLKPSTTLSAADALEALAGLANSLPAVPNVPVRQSAVHEPSPNYSDSRSQWSSHHYSSYSDGSQPAIRPESSHQYYNQYSQVQDTSASHGVMSGAHSSYSWTGNSNAAPQFSSVHFGGGNSSHPVVREYHATGIMPHYESVESVSGTAPSDAAAGPVNVPANDQP